MSPNNTFNNESCPEYLLRSNRFCPCSSEFPEMENPQPIKPHSPANTPTKSAEESTEKQPPSVVIDSNTTNIVFITTGYDQVIKFWDPLNGNCIRTIPYPESHINCMSLSRDKLHLVVGSNPNARIFDVNGQVNTPTMVYQGHKGNITGIGCQRDFKWIFTASEDKRIKIWDTRSPKPQREYINSCSINAAVLHPNQGEIYTVDQKGSLKIWDLVSDCCTQELVRNLHLIARFLKRMYPHNQSLCPQMAHW